MAYALRNELTDATLEDAFHTLPTKAAAVRVARGLAKRPSFMVARIIVWNVKTDSAVAVFEAAQEPGL